MLFPPKHLNESTFLIGEELLLVCKCSGSVAAQGLGSSRGMAFQDCGLGRHCQAQPAKR